MSNKAINIRILFWHFGVTYEGRVSFTLNWHWVKHWVKALIVPIAFYDFRPHEIKFGDL